MRERVHTTFSGNKTEDSRNGHSIHTSLPADQSLREKVTPDPVAAPLHMTSTEFTTAMVHFYRGEIQRSNTWRNRLDTTTNWAVLTTGATLSFVFSSPTNPAFVIPINSILVAIFMFMEARRYRYYEVWAKRVRVLETGYFAPMLSPRNLPKDQEWADHIASDLISPHFTISELEAVGRRLRGNYIWIFVLLALSYMLKIYLHPFPAPNLDTFFNRAEVGLVPGWFVFSVGVFFNVTLFGFAIFTLKLKEAASEVLPHHDFSWHPLRSMTDWTRNAASIRRQATERRADRARKRVKQSSSDIHKSEITNKV